jgi:hypothetical protein
MVYERIPIYDFRNYSFDEASVILNQQLSSYDGRVVKIGQLSCATLVEERLHQIDTHSNILEGNLISYRGNICFRPFLSHDAQSTHAKLIKLNPFSLEAIFLKKD